MTLWPPYPTCHDHDPHAQRWAQHSASGRTAEWVGPIDADPRADPGCVSYQPFRTCSYCGAMHPEDLLAALRAGATVQPARGGGKLYVEVPHAHPEREVWAGSWSGPRYRCRACGFEPPTRTEAFAAIDVALCEHVQRVEEYQIIGTHRIEAWRPVGATVHGKFYAEHLADLSPAALDLLLPALTAATGIRYVRSPVNPPPKENAR